MRKILLKTLGVLFCMVVLVYILYSPRLKFDVLENPNKQASVKKENVQKTDAPYENKKPDKGIATWIGKDITSVTKILGQAVRSYPIDNHMKQYIFKAKQAYYIITTKHKKVKAVYATGEKAQIQPYHIKDSADDIFENTNINLEPTVKHNGKTYQFELSDEDVKTQALIRYGDIYAQVYIDQVKHEIVAVRFLDAEALVKLKPYQISGKEGATADVRDDATQLPHETGKNELYTLYEVTNALRHIRGMAPLKASERLESVATDNMDAVRQENGSFTEHILKQQLNEARMTYYDVGQTVGYDFDDVPTVAHSWLNSDVHRSTLLSDQFTIMGGDVSDGYYSLIFINDGDEVSS